MQKGISIIAETYKKFNGLYQDAVQQVMDDYELDEKTAKEKLDEFW